MADGGTLFLDEIGEIDAGTQVKLLRALGEQTVERVGSNKPIHVDVRVIAATNKNLARLVEQGAFREDLFYRLNVVRIGLPPLRERKEDILPLARHFLKSLAERNNKPYRDLSPDALKVLTTHDWPGNVRELRTALEHGIVMCSGARILPHHLPAWLTGGNDLPRPKPAPKVIETTSPLRELLVPKNDGDAPEDLNLASQEKRLILAALRKTGDNKTEAAKLLGISRRTLQRKWKELF
jgi:DNA-binding NtrC family response regulator